MANKEKILEIASNICSILSMYEEIHATIFDRLVLGIFQPINFIQHKNNVEKILYALEFRNRELENLSVVCEQSEREFLTTLQDYTLSFIDVCQRLVVILIGLSSKSLQSISGKDYDAGTYQQDFARYEKAFDHHKTLGEPLNNLFKKLGI